MDLTEKESQKYVWYACYGSNLFMGRFMDYVKKCRDKSPPKRSKKTSISYPLYFAKNSGNWGGGVAFIGRRKNKGTVTLGRIYLITEQQLEDVISQENGCKKVTIDFENIKKKGSSIVLDSWYGNVISIGQKQGFPVFTFTNPNHMRSELPNKPSEKYLRRIIWGLKETYKLNDKRILEYLIKKREVKGKIKKKELEGIIKAAIRLNKCRVRS